MENQDMKGFILAILIVGITLVIGIYLADIMATNFRATGTPNNIVNETVTTVTDDGVYLAKYTELDSSCSATAICVNTTGNYLIPSGNYTISSACLLTYTGIQNNGGFNNSNWKCSYSYTFTNDTKSSTASTALVSALSGGSAWITILIVVGFAVIVLGMLSEGLGRAASGVGAPQYTY